MGSLEHKAMEVFKKYVEMTVKLLDVEELEAERAFEESSHDNQARGSLRNFVIKNLVVVECNVVSYGAFNVKFELTKSNTLTNACKLSKNCIVVVRPENGPEDSLKECWGVVIINNDTTLVVQFDSSYCFAEATDQTFTLRVKRNSVTKRRMQAILKHLVKNPGRATHLIQFRFGGKNLCLYKPLRHFTHNKNMVFHNSNLSDRQKIAVDYCTQVKFAVIHGPPGTGKTTTLVELILQFVEDGKKLLVCTPSNTALDNVIEKASQYRLKMVRLGLQAKISNNIVQGYSIHTLLSQMASQDMIEDVRKDINETVAKLRVSNFPVERQILCSRLHELRQELLHRESKAIIDVLVSSQVIFATLSSASSDGILKNIPDGFFEVVIIDECAQALEPEAWIAIPWAHKCYIFGDHHQLAPLVLSREAIQNGLNISLMERLVKKAGEDSCIMLERQFRMNEKINSWVSNQFYSGKLISDTTVAHQLLCDLPGVEETFDTNTPLIFINTGGCKLSDHQSTNLSYGNEGEAEVTALMVKRLIKTGVPANTIAVITPYRKQVQLIMKYASRLELPEELEVQTVDGFQGREKEAVILSFVRSNLGQKTGFIFDRPRTNVAVSRAKRLLCVIGDECTLSSEPLFASLIIHIKTEGLVISGFEFLEELSVQTSKAPKQSLSKQRKKLTNIPCEEDWDSPNLINMLPEPQNNLIEKQDRPGNMIESEGEEKVFNIICEDFFDSTGIIDALPFNILQEEEDGPGDVIQSEDENDLDCSGITDKLPINVFADGEDCSVVHGGSSHKKSRRNRGGHAATLVTELRHSLSDVQKCKGAKNGAGKDSHSISTSEKSNRFNRSVSDYKPDTSIDSNMEEEMFRKFAVLNRTCAFANCKGIITMIFFDCKLCCKRYCIPHSLPEVHGCGTEAKRAAKKDFVHPVPKELNPKAKKDLAKKLEEKLSALSKERNRGNPKKKPK